MSNKIDMTNREFFQFLTEKFDFKFPGGQDMFIQMSKQIEDLEKTIENQRKIVESVYKENKELELKLVNYNEMKEVTELIQKFVSFGNVKECYSNGIFSILKLEIFSKLALCDREKDLFYNYICNKKSQES